MSPSTDMRVGDIEVRPHEHVVLAGGCEVSLSSREFDIVRSLAEHPGWVFSASQLCGDSEDGAYSPDSVSVLVSRVRHKLAEAGVPDAIETVRGCGYRLHGLKSVTGADGSAAAEAEQSDRDLRDAYWRLQEAVIEVEHSGTVGQKEGAAEVLERARRDLYASLAE